MSRYQTRGVLAGAYKGKRAPLNATLTHLVDTQDASGGFDALCGRVKPGNMGDEYGDPEGNAKEPTCERCRKLWLSHNTHARVSDLEITAPSGKYLVDREPDGAVYVYSCILNSFVSGSIAGVARWNRDRCEARESRTLTDADWCEIESALRRA